jgi:tetratricopeptide (TPR) repeat protein
LAEEVEIGEEGRTSSGSGSSPLAVEASEALESILEKVDGKRRWWQWEEEAEKFKRTDPQQADRIYQESLQHFPNSTELLGNYAYFLETQKKDLDQAQQLYELAIKPDPQHTNNLCNYANFLWQVRQDLNAAQVKYEEALKADRDNPVTRCNYIGLLLARGKEEQAVQLLDRPHDKLTRLDPPSLRVEIWFYMYAHLPDRYPAALGELKKFLLVEGIRSPNWNLVLNVERAIRDGHAEGTWLKELSRVVNGKVGPEALEGWGAWQDAT